ncbi:MAG: hypothetical protein UT30_C0043G0002 [Candidatus Uhrbacteria bacterium GW2011_GWF2_39_13]|uniref:Uncharacterized protein n=1 Tax=Candidatus Uhrbacteria bacterium GW2011_GWF2_39_13 TaxID=1618995 RepID=A0A0G0QMN1_9BACT|nr:MAG: hypothetical protein UT30_C0043G0002 [Candidatus Uhrbacteria bacterium GW2011_GWF2_39_13]
MKANLFNIKGFSMINLRLLTFLIFVGVIKNIIAEGKEEIVFLDPGGCSVEISTKYERDVEGFSENLLKNHSFEESSKTGRPLFWNNILWMSSLDKEILTDAVKKNPTFCSAAVSSKFPFDGEKCLAIETSIDLFKNFKVSKPSVFQNGYSQYCNLSKSLQEKKYWLKVFVKGITSLEINGAVKLQVDFFDHQEQPRTRTQKSISWRLSPTGSWQEENFDFFILPETACVQVSVFLLGAGNVNLDGLGLYQENICPGIKVRLFPGFFMDNLFCLSENGPGIIAFALKRETSHPSNENLNFHILLPEEIKIIGTREGTKIISQNKKEEKGKNYIYYQIDINSLKNKIGKKYYIKEALSLVLRSEHKYSDEIYKAKYWITEGSETTPQLEFELKITPSIVAETPQIFKSSGHFTEVDNCFNNINTAKEIAQLYRKAGFNEVYIAPGTLSNVFREMKIHRYYQYLLVNGYGIGAKEKPDAVAFHLLNGKLDKYGICPVEVYKNGNYFKEEVVGKLRKAIVEERAFDSVMSNWEPFMFSFKGCFCQRCKEDFAQYSRLPMAEVEKEWPSEILIKRREIWIKFRAWQHGQVVKTLENMINGLGREAGIEAHFIPYVMFLMFVPYSKFYDAQISLEEWADKLPYIGSWGPYCWWDFSKTHLYNTGQHIVMHKMNTEVRNFLNTYVPKDKRPKLIGYPHVYQGNTYVTQPERIAFDSLTYFVNGWDGNSLYVFPKGYDARYWNAVALVNTIIAKFEKFTLRGEKVYNYKYKLETPVPKIAPKYRYMPEKVLLRKDDAEIVQFWEYQNGEERFFVVGNFWEKGECFFKLIPEKVEEGKTYVLYEPLYNRCYSNENATCILTSTDLSKGILLHVGAMRYSFYILMPFSSEKNYGSIVSPSSMNYALNCRFSKIEEAYKNELIKKESSKSLEKTIAFSKGKLVCNSVNLKDSSNRGISFASPSQKIIIDPASGGNIKSWIVNDCQIVYQHDVYGLFGDAFWWPPKSIASVNKSYEVISLKKTSKGMELILKSKLDKHVKPLDGLSLLKTYLIPESGSGFEIEHKIINESSEVKEFAFRSHNLLTFLGLSKNAAYWGLLNDKGSIKQFHRDFKIKIFNAASAGNDMELEKIISSWNVSSTSAFIEPVVCFSNSQISFNLKFELDKKDLYGFLFWDSLAADCATFEPLYKRMQLRPQEAWKSKIKCGIEKLSE